MKSGNLGVLFDVAFNSFTSTFIKIEQGSFKLLNNNTNVDISTTIPVYINGKMLPQYLNY